MDAARLMEILAWEERSIASDRAQLLEQMRWLARHLTETADRLERDPARLPNSVGEVQSRGTDIDVAIGNLVGRTKIANQFRKYLVTEGD